MCESKWQSGIQGKLTNYNQESGADGALGFSTMARDTLRPRPVAEFLAVPDTPPPPRICHKALDQL